MPRENSSSWTCKNDSTDAVHRGGLIGSSDEAFVMNAERSDQIIQLMNLINRKPGGINAKSKVI